MAALEAALISRDELARAPGDSDPAAGNGVPAYVHEAQRVFADQIAAGEVPTVRAIRSGLGVGSHRAQQVRAHIEALTRN